MMSRGSLEKLKRAYPIKRVAAVAHFPTPWLFEPAFAQTIEPTNAWAAVSSPSVQQVLVFTVEWTGARQMGEQW